jgi:hypothetical protein
LSKKSKKMHKHGLKHVEEEVEEIEKDVKKIEKDINVFAKFENVIFEIIIILIFGIALGALAGYMVGASAQNTGLSGTESALSAGNVISEAPVGLAQKIETFVNTNLIGDPSVKVTVTDSGEEPLTVYSYNYEIDQNGLVVEEGTFFSTEDNLIIGNQFPLEETEPTDNNEPEEPTTAYTQSEEPVVDLFIMSFCPYGLQAVDAFNEPIKLLNDSISFNMGYVIYSDYASGYGLNWEDYCYDEEEKYCSMHGISELNEDVREMCIQKYQNDKFWPYMDLLVEDYLVGKVSYMNIEEKWKDYATAAGVDISAVETCFNEEAEELLEEQVFLNQMYGVRGSPTAVINGTQYSGARTAEGFKTAICSSFLSAPEECELELNDTTQAAAGSC